MKTNTIKHNSEKQNTIVNKSLLYIYDYGNSKHKCKSRQWKGSHVLKSSIEYQNETRLTNHKLSTANHKLNTVHPKSNKVNCKLKRLIRYNDHEKTYTTHEEIHQIKQMHLGKSNIELHDTHGWITPVMLNRKGRIISRMLRFGRGADVSKQRKIENKREIIDKN